MRGRGARLEPLRLRRRDVKKALRLSLFALVCLALFASGGAVYLAHFTARAIVQPKTAQPVQTPADLGLDYEAVTVTAPDGALLRGWYLPSRNGAAVIVQHSFIADRQAAEYDRRVVEFFDRHLSGSSP